MQRKQYLTARDQQAIYWPIFGLHPRKPGTTRHERFYRALMRNPNIAKLFVCTLEIMADKRDQLEPGMSAKNARLFTEVYQEMPQTGEAFRKAWLRDVPPDTTVHMFAFSEEDYTNVREVFKLLGDLSEAGYCAMPDDFRRWLRLKDIDQGLSLQH